MWAWHPHSLTSPHDQSRLNAMDAITLFGEQAAYGGGPAWRSAMTIRSRLLHRLAVAAAVGVMTVPAMAVEPTSKPSDSARAHAGSERPHCLRDTGSRIVSAHNERVRREVRRSNQDTDTTEPGAAATRCVSAHGRVYSREDLDSTGAIDLGDALRQLDPAIR